jgi:signal transduction histidine kinase
MEYKETLRKTKIEPQILRISLLFAACSIFYYLPTMTGLDGGPLSSPSLFSNLHNFYGLDFYALVFFIPVVYAAYLGGVMMAIVTALMSMVIFIPYSLIITNQPGALFRPTAFVLILSAVGAVVAMLQRSDEDRRQNLDGLKCLYSIGKAAEHNGSVEKFISDVTTIIFNELGQHGYAGVSITLRGKTYGSGTKKISRHKSIENIIVGGEAIGTLEIFYKSISARSKKSSHFVKTLAERIGGAIYSIELEHSLKNYYEQLEEMVENRTRELERAQEKLIRSERLAAVGELASGVGHELRNPLNVIRNCVYLINMTLNGKTPPEVEDNLKLLDLQVDISNKIVTDLLDFTRVKAPCRSTVDLSNMLKDRISWASIPENVKVKYDPAENKPQLNVDAEQIGRVFTNIINNAIQSINGCGELRIATGDSDKFGWVTFTDNGCGIPAENLNKIFEPLFTTKPKGVGLGLAISKRMVEQNDGEIEVESIVGKGTTFKVKLPLIIKEVPQHETAGQYTGCR